MPLICVVWLENEPIDTIGGSALLAWMTNLGHAKQGARLQPKYSDRDDALVCKTEPFTESVTLIGRTEV